MCHINIFSKRIAFCVDPYPLELNLTKRAEERKQHELRKQEAERAASIMEAELNRREEMRDRQELIKLRKETVIKPAPIKQYKALVIKGSEKPLTQPKSPRFHH